MYNTPAWRSIRRSVIESPEGAVCYLCGRALSTIGDHFIPHRGDPTLFYNRDNVRGACKPCHDWKTTIEEHLRNWWRTAMLKMRRTDLEEMLPW